MRLINIDTYDLEDFIGSQTPAYAILSHCWGSEEVIFQEWQTSRETAKHKAGYRKIIGACEKARAYGYKYLWCDTNCIDKSSSAELSEAINSMFAWYRDSGICFAYLEDVEIKEYFQPDSIQSKLPSFRESKWFTRGWTLQELVAPKHLVFVSQDWEKIGDKKEIAPFVSKITKIPEDELQDFRPDRTSVAARMSWAASRETTRLEDTAYCLLGIFEINMPLLYGEGKRAFRRLQEEILKSTIDLSLLVWDPIPQKPEQNLVAQLFAESPRCFRNCRDIYFDGQIDACDNFNLVGPGVFLNLKVLHTVDGILSFAKLNCYQRTNQGDSPIWIPLLLNPRSNRPDTFPIYVPLHRRLPHIIIDRGATHRTYHPPQRVPSQRVLIQFYSVDPPLSAYMMRPGKMMVCVHPQYSILSGPSWDSPGLITIRIRSSPVGQNSSNLRANYKIEIIEWAEPQVRESQVSDINGRYLHVLVVIDSYGGFGALDGYLVSYMEFRDRWDLKTPLPRISFIMGLSRKTLYRYESDPQKLVQKLVALPTFKGIMFARPGERIDGILWTEDISSLIFLRSPKSQHKLVREAVSKVPLKPTFLFGTFGANTRTFRQLFVLGPANWKNKESDKL